MQYQHHPGGLDSRNTVKAKIQETQGQKKTSKRKQDAGNFCHYTSCKLLPTQMTMCNCLLPQNIGLKQISTCSGEKKKANHQNVDTKRGSFSIPHFCNLFQLETAPPLQTVYGSLELDVKFSQPSTVLRTLCKLWHPKMHFQNLLLTSRQH